MRLGYSQELARKRIAWVPLDEPAGLEYTLNDCVKINGAKVFEVALDDMMAQGGAFSTQRLWELFDYHMGQAVAATAEGIAFHLEHQEDNEPSCC